ncbi:MAG: response regulator transcription factor [Bacteroidia bacterium]|nr:response regulator transcription factor [Bacteroidia bacterium]MCZ2247347.1 response regulator transcription factor [Bacteroidia bacterium]
MSLINVVIANSNYLTGMALSILIDELPAYQYLGTAKNEGQLQQIVSKKNVDLVVIDFSSDGFNINTIVFLKKNYPQIKTLAISSLPSKETALNSFKSGVHSYILNDCGKEEIIEALEKTSEGTDFICGKILHQLELIDNTTISNSLLTCGGVSITDRELDIIKLIAEGLSNKQIAEKLCLSTHTVNTHRKNIMNKLGVNNTAGLVMFAVKENLLGTERFNFSSFSN